MGFLIAIVIILISILLADYGMRHKDSKLVCKVMALIMVIGLW